MNATTAEAKMINLKIVQAQAEIEKHFFVLQSQFNHVTPVMLKNAYLGLPLSHSKAKPEKAAGPSQTLLAAFDEFIAIFEKKAKKGIRSEGTLQHWRSTKRKVEAFICFRYQRKDIEMINIDRIGEVRDACIFQCFTGFAYQDMYNFSPENYVQFLTREYCKG